ncbi:hypothetical protein FZC83_02150 [Rossellomorea marisflavi]|uniref:Uncharacterized protein n=1 Tax=Rossellomorea marisflavi TaxID=189381 RepID=A0A5D4S2L7_9BACI|nr:hypothetical protein [Rossellomorea marisflavi]TYS56398.1 hypothetical protein FZC83_02150 [Rossellomorea marisflavi]
MGIESKYVQYTIAVYHELFPEYKYIMIANAVEAINKKMKKLNLDIKKTAEYLEGIDNTTKMKWLRKHFGVYFVGVAKTYFKMCRLHPLYL